MTHGLIDGVPARAVATKNTRSVDVSFGHGTMMGFVPPTVALPCDTNASCSATTGRALRSRSTFAPIRAVPPARTCRPIVAVETLVSLSEIVPAQTIPAAVSVKHDADASETSRL